jgi:Astacin (Peptidase family M12A)
MRILLSLLVALVCFYQSVSAQRCGCPRLGWSPNSFRAYILFEDQLTPVVVDDVNGEAVFGGDVILGSAKKLREDAALIERAGGVDAVNRNPSLVPDSARNGQRPWANRVVPYSGVSSLSPRFRRIFNAAVAHWERVLGGDIDFRPRQRGDTRHMRVVEVPGTTCSWNASTNTLALAAGGNGRCTRHEIGHALGLAHEHKRHDRDTFVTVNWDNVKTRSCSQFDQLPERLSEGDYDLSSVMHYTARTASCNRRATLTAVPPGVIGRRFDLITEGDVAGVRRAQGIGAARDPALR